MKKSILLFVVSMFSFGFCVQSAVADGFFGKKPEKSIYASVGYLMKSKSTSRLVHLSEYYRKSFEKKGGESETKEIHPDKPAVKLGWNISTRFFTEMNCVVGETKLENWCGYLCEVDFYDSNGNLLPKMQEYYFEYQEINIESSPEFSLNYALLNSSKFCLYIGGGTRYVSIKYKNDYFRVGGGRKISLSDTFTTTRQIPSTKVGMKFLILGNVLGSVDYTYCPITIYARLISTMQCGFATSFGDGYLQANIGIGF